MKDFIEWAKADIRTGENIDLWLLVAVALATTALGATGVASATVLSSVVLSTMALLAISQLRARREITASLAAYRAARLELFHLAFPDEYYERRERLTTNYLFVGLTMQRTLSTGRPAFESLLARGGSIRVLLPNPDDLPLLGMVSDSYRHMDSPSAIAASVKSTISTLRAMHSQHGGVLEVRLMGMPARVGFNALDIGTPSGVVMVQHYEFRPESEAGPIILLHAEQDEPWYSRFLAEAERLWAYATPAP